jgi:hypothetical protein
MLVICFRLVVQMGLDRFKPPLECGDSLLMNFLERVDCLASGLEAFGGAHGAADDPGDRAANHACREMNPQDESDAENEQRQQEEVERDVERLNGHSGVRKFERG